MISCCETRTVRRFLSPVIGLSIVNYGLVGVLSIGASL